MAHRGSTELCLACSASLPPRGAKDVFTTKCCGQPICHNCIKKNPRLASLDGGLKDDDVFILGDDEDDEDAGTVAQEINPSSQPLQSAAIDAQLHAGLKAQKTELLHGSSIDPVKYYIKRGDTLQGIAFKFKSDGRLLCRMNNLPSSTLTTTPHLIHTRQYILLPVGSSVESHSVEENKERELARARERAIKRVQMVTKEIDRDVAKAYVALAEDVEDSVEYEAKLKESGMSPIGRSTIEAIATDMYMEDDQWAKTYTGRE